MRHSRLKLLLLSLMCFSSVVESEVVSVFNNFGVNDAYNKDFSADIGMKERAEGPYTNTVANAFTVSHELSALNLCSIEVALGIPRNNQGRYLVTLGLFNDSAGVPGVLLEEFEINLDAWDRIYKVDSIENTRLDAGMQYWVVADVVDPTASFGWMYNGIAPFFTETGPSLIKRSYDEAWIDRSHLGQQGFRISGVTVVSLPGALWLFASALGFVRCVRRKIPRLE